jgi:ABC-type ATPase involved in cell division
MTRKTKDQMDAERYAAKVIAEMSTLSDEEVLAVAAEEKLDIKKEASRIRTLLLDAATAHGKKRLKQAKAKVEEADKQSASSCAVVLSFEQKRAKLARLIAQNPQLTLAARQGQGLDESEVDDQLADLADLGITESDDHNGA